MISTSRELTDSICSNIVDNESQIEIVPLITYESLKLKIKYKQGNEEKMLNKEIIRPIGNLFQGGYEYSYVIDLVKDTLIAQ